MEKRTFKWYNLLFIVFVGIFMLANIFAGNSLLSSVYAYSGEEEDTAREGQLKFSNENKFFSDAVQPRWYVYGEPIFYSSRKYDLFDKNPSETKIQYTFPVNTELYFVNATDTSDTTIKLKPTLDIWDFTGNEIAESHCGIIFEDAWKPTPLTYSKDNMSLKDINGELNVPGVTKWVDYGKILHRTAPYSSTTHPNDFGEWSFIDLEDDASLFFNGPQLVQIVIIYELKESLFKYHNLIAWYNIRIANR